MFIDCYKVFKYLLLLLLLTQQYIYIYIYIYIFHLNKCIRFELCCY
ncbi:MAG: hypothetical protein MCS20_01490 [Candidatus Phytoplasma mali]|nr:hypothetical protein [Candidatus Phytoplasma australiense]MCG7202068.1 hypothetical protein [Candidatus Phytoplasma mali]